MRRRRPTPLPILLLALALPGRPAAAAPAPAAAPPVEARRLLEALRDAAGIPGLSVAVGVGDRVVWTEGFGLADLESGALAGPATRYRAASVSKVLSVAVAARLWADGRLDMDAPVASYVPAFDGPAAVTPRLLAGHLAGIRHYRDGDDTLGFRHFGSIGAALPAFVGDSLQAAPGSAYGYSTFGYVLLSAALEAAGGRPFLELLDETVAAPLGMSGTGPDLVSAVLPGRSGTYASGPDGSVVHAPYEDPSYKWAGGGLLTTAPDLVRFALAHADGGFLPPRILTELFTSQRTASGEATGVGIGWRVGTDGAGRRIVHHAGSMGGARSVVMLWPERRLAVAILTNLRATPALIEQTAEIVARAWLDPAPADADPPAGTPSGRFRYEGVANGEPAGGELSLGAGPDARGWIETPARWLALARANGMPAADRLELLGGRPVDGGVELVLATSLGLVPLTLTPAADGRLRGELSAGPLELAFEAVPKPA